jgi:hypothetical protein
LATVWLRARQLDPTSRAFWPTICRRAILGLYAGTAALVTLQRGVLGPRHTTFLIFRRSFWHLLAGANLYARYPLEQGAAPADLFKYSPTAALLFGAVALPPYFVALFAWSLLGALLVWHVLQKLVPENQALVAAVLVYPDLLSSMQACSSNALVAGLIALAFVLLEEAGRLRAAATIVVGTAIKIFPVAALTFAVFHPRRRRFVLLIAVAGLAALLLPLVVTPPATLVQQYRWWHEIESFDAADLSFGFSAMQLVRRLAGAGWPSWPMQLAGTMLLVMPLALRRSEWVELSFRRAYLTSMLAFAVLFNHQAEHPSFVIASLGVAIWCVSPPERTRHVWIRGAVGLLALIGLHTVPLLLVWVLMQAELFGALPFGDSRVLASARGNARAEPTALGTFGESLTAE